MDVERTPGEWSVLNAQEPIGDFSYTIHAEGYGCVGFWKGFKSWHADSNWLLKEADAHLISASPKLLDACEKARHRLIKEGFTANDPTVKLLNVAIAKATGK